MGQNSDAINLAATRIGGRGEENPINLDRRGAGDRFFRMIKRETFLPFGRPVFEESEIAAVADVLRSGWISTGPRAAEFQRMMSEYTGCRFTLGLSSCTAGLFLALKILDVGPGDEVIVPPFTFAATANVVVHCGATPVFADVLLDTCTMDPERFAAAITGRTRAVIPVHLYGRPAAIARIRAIAAEHGIAVIGDCAHATEAQVNGENVARLADVSSLSFYATKNLAVGEGGMLCTDSEEHFRRAEVLALHGMSRGAYKRFSESGFKFYDVVEAGYKFNMTDISAALGIEQFKRLEKRLLRRTAIWERYDAAFADLPLVRPAPVEPGTVHARHLYTLRTTGKLDRNRLIERIQRANIGVAVHYLALHLNSFYRDKYGCARGEHPNAELISDTTFSIPLTPYLTDEDVELIIGAVRESVTELT